MTASTPRNALHPVSRALSVLLIILLTLCVFAPLASADDAPTSSSGASTASSASSSSSLEADSAGTVCTIQEKLIGQDIPGDLYWFGAVLSMEKVKSGSDVVSAGSSIDITDATIGQDFRAIADTMDISGSSIGGVMTVAGRSIDVKSDVTTEGMYAGAERITFSGKAKRLVAYGQEVTIDGKVEGDVTVSAQKLVIGPDAEVTGTLYVHSGQYPDIPSTAKIAKVDNTLDQPNTLDQVTEIRAQIAPWFTVGSVLFLAVSFIVAALIALWLVDHKLREANRILRKHPLGMLLAGVAALVLVPLIVAVMFMLVFTAPIAIILLLLMVVAAFICVPFTAASFGLMLPDSWNRSLRVVLMTVLFTVLLFAPYVNGVVFGFSMIYLLGYVLYTMVVGHDSHHDEAHANKERMSKAEGEATATSKQGAQHAEAKTDDDAVVVIPRGEVRSEKETAATSTDASAETEAGEEGSGKE